jgi:hypothetical protein
MIDNVQIRPMYGYHATLHCGPRLSLAIGFSGTKERGRTPSTEGRKSLFGTKDATAEKSYTD